MKDRSDSALFLGLDLSTQQLKAVLMDCQCAVVGREAVNFSRDIPELSGTDGVSREGQTAWSLVEMFLCALDILLSRLKNSFELRRVLAISGTAQQHGTVYWSAAGESSLAAMQSGDSFCSALAAAFARHRCPIWMDSSTSEYTAKFDKLIPNLNEISGSKAYHRFSGPQIAKIFDQEPHVYANTSRISLISSFLPSLLLGRVAPIDLCDACGTNLLDIRKGDWSNLCLSVVVGEDPEAIHGLRQRLGTPAPSNTVLGTVTRFLVEAFNFNPACQVVAFTGDNMSSMADLNVTRGDVILSLGTSDTAIFPSEFSPLALGHLFIHPTQPEEYITLICYKNGSLTRERIREEIGVSWEELDGFLKQTPVGNDGYIGIYLDMDEIEPRVPMGDYRWLPDGKLTEEKFAPHVETRALLEGQILHLRANSPAELRRVVVTGGASNNSSIRQIIADVFGRPVYTAPLADSAALGGAKRAKYAFDNPSTPYASYFSSDVIEAARPNQDAVLVYEAMLKTYKERESQLLGANCAQINTATF